MLLLTSSTNLTKCMCQYVLRIIGKVMSGFPQMLLRKMVIRIFRSPSSFILKAMGVVNRHARFSLFILLYMLLLTSSMNLTKCMFSPLRMCVSACQYVLKIIEKIMNGIPQMLMRTMIIRTLRSPSGLILKAISVANTVIKALTTLYICLVLRFVSEAS